MTTWLCDHGHVGRRESDAVRGVITILVVVHEATMGNCMVKKRGHYLLREEDPTSWKMESTEASDDVLSPTSTAVSTVVLSPDASVRQLTYFMPEDRPVLPKRRSTAYQSRLDKARSLQQALACPRPVTPTEQDAPTSWNTTTPIWQTIPMDSVQVLATTNNPLGLILGTGDGRVVHIPILDSPTQALGSATVLWHGDTRIRALATRDDYILVAGDDGVARLWKAGQFVCERPRMDRLYAAACGGDYWAVGGYDDCVAIYNYHGDLIREVTIPGFVWSLDWFESALAVGCSDKKCRIVKGTQVTELRRSAAVKCVKWHPKGKWLAVGSNNLAIFSQDGALRYELDGKVESVCWSPNGGYLVYSGPGLPCTLVETQSFAQVQVFHRETPVQCLSWAGHALSRRYLALAGDSGVDIIKSALETGGDDQSSTSPSHASSYFSNRGEWVLKEDMFRDVEETSVRTIAFSRGSKSRPSAFFASCSDDGNVTVRSTVNWKVATQIHLKSPVRCMAFSHGSRFLAIGGEDGVVHVYMTAPRWACLATIDFSAPVTCLGFYKNNELLAVGSLDGTLTLVDPRSAWQKVAVLNDNESPILSLDWTSKNLAIGRHDGSILVFSSDQVVQQDLASCDVFSLPTPVRSLTIGVNSRFLVAGGDDGTAYIFSSKNEWELCHRVDGEGPISAIQWSPTGRHLAIAGAETRLIDTIFWTDVQEATDAFVATSQSPKCGTTGGIAFGQDGSVVALCGSECGVTVVDTGSWQVLLGRDSTECVDDVDMDQSSISSTEDYRGLDTAEH